MSNFSDNFSDDSSSPPVAPRNVDSKEFSFDIPIQIEASSKEEAEQFFEENLTIEVKILSNKKKNEFDIH